MIGYRSDGSWGDLGFFSNRELEQMAKDHAAPQAEQADALWTAEQCEEVLNRKAPPHYGELAFIAMSLRARLAAATERAEGAEREREQARDWYQAAEEARAKLSARNAELEEALREIRDYDMGEVVATEGWDESCQNMMDRARAALAARTATPDDARPAE